MTFVTAMLVPTSIGEGTISSHFDDDQWREYNSLINKKLHSDEEFTAADERALRELQVLLPDYSYQKRENQTQKGNNNKDFGKYNGDFVENADQIKQDLGIPDHWQHKPSKKDGGIRFFDPDNNGNHIRVMPGRTTSPYKNSQKPYTIRYKNGSPVDKDGNPIKNESGQNQNRSPHLHVPMDIFKY